MLCSAILYYFSLCCVGTSDRLFKYGGSAKEAIYFLLLPKDYRAILAVSNCHHGKVDDPHHYC